MTKKAKTMRIVVNGVLLAAIVAMGVTVYQASSERQQKQQQLQEEQAKKNDSEKAQVEEVKEEELVDAGTNQVEVTSEDDLQAEATLEPVEEKEVSQQAASDTVEMSQETATAIPSVDFTEDTLMIWPLAGDILLDYSMEETIYHPTLDLYQCSAGIAVSAPEESPVLAAANGIVTSVAQDARTGLTVTTDLGNGYTALYGQLQNVQVQEGQTIGQSTIIGYVSAPTKYYTVEGSNLYFSMSKDGTPIDPVTYLP